MIGLVMPWFSEKVLISDRCICGFMPNLHKKSWMISITGVPQKPQEELETLGHSYLNTFLDFIMSTFPKCFLIPLPLALRNPYQTNCTIWFAILLYNLGLILVQVKVRYSQRVFSFWSNPEKKQLFSLKWFISFFFENGTK